MNLIPGRVDGALDRHDPFKAQGRGGLRHGYGEGSHPELAALIEADLVYHPRCAEED